MPPKMKKRFSGFLALLCAGTLVCVLAGALMGCSKEPEAPTKAPDESQNNTRSFTDSLGREVQIPQEVTGVAPSGPVAQQILLTIAPEKLVGLSGKLTEDQKKYLGNKYDNLTVFGQIYGGKGDLNKEAIANANTQVIIDIGEQKKGISDELDTLQDQIGIPCVHIEAKYDSYDKTYTMLGELLGKTERAKTLADYCSQIYAETEQKMSSVPADKRVRALYCTGENGTNVIPKGSFQASVFDLVCDNQAVLNNASSSGSGNEVSLEQIANWSPDLILFAPQSVFGQVGKDSSWLSLNAIASGNYFQIPGSPYNWLSSPPSINQMLGLLWLPRICYPDLYNDNMFDIVSKYYQTFNSYTLTQDDYNTIMKGAIPQD